jgi:glutamyl-tRNA synthetase
VTLADRAALGESAADVLAYLASTAGLAQPGERVSAAELVGRFRPDVLAATARAA